MQLDVVNECRRLVTLLPLVEKRVSRLRLQFVVNACTEELNLFCACGEWFVKFYKCELNKRVVMALAMMALLAMASMMINEAVKYTVKVEIEGQSNSNDTGQTESIAREITVNVMGMLNQPMLGEASSAESAGAQMPHSVTVTTSGSSSETATGSTCVAGGYGVRTNASSSTAMEVVSDGGSGSSWCALVEVNASIG